MTGLVRRHPILASLVLIAVAGGCGDTGCGCGEQPLDTDLAPQDKIYDGIVAEISPDGFAFIQQNFSQIVGQFMPGGLTFDLPPASSCKKDTWNCNGQMAICRQGAPCPVSATVHDVGLATMAPNRLKLDASVDITSGNIPLEVCQDLLACAVVGCGFSIQLQNKPVSADVVIGQDNLSKALTFDVQNVNVSIQGGDFRINGGLLCDIADWGFVRNFIAGFANDQLAAQIPQLVKDQLDAFTCMPCDFYGAGCAGAGGNATCDGGSGFCVDPATNECVHKPMGLVGRIDANQVVGSMLPVGGGSAVLDISAGAGQEMPTPNDPVVPRDGGPLDLRLITGVHGEPSPCVPGDAPPPDTSAPPRIDFASEAAGEPYMVGVGISDRFLDKTFYEAYRSGALCVDLGSDAIAFVSTGLFKTFLPSLDSLTEGRDAPMLISLRPKAPPTVDVGAGTWHDENGTTVLDDPLLDVHMPSMDLDVYAFIEERYVRLFRLSLDLELPLALDLTPQNELVPILGDLGSLVTNVHASQSEVLAEDPAVLQDLIPAILGLAEPMLAGALQPIALPAIQGFTLKVNKLEGMVPAATPGTYEHLGILAGLEMAGAPMPLRAETSATLAAVRLPPRERLVPAPGRSLGLPEVFVDVQAFDARRASPGLEWQYRVDAGLWSPFQRTPRLDVRSPKFLLQGRHVIDVRARSVDDYRTLDPTPARVEAVIDWEPPSARLTFDAATGTLAVDAKDLVSPARALRYAFSVDGAPFGAFGTEPSLVVPVDAREVQVQVRDEAGNTAELTWSALAGLRARAGETPSVGCAASGGSGGAFVLLLAAAAIAGVRRRRR